MTKDQLIALFTGVPGDALIMGLDVEGTTSPFTITGAVPETHHDADGSTTVWLQLEEI